MRQAHGGHAALVVLRGLLLLLSFALMLPVSAQAQRSVLRRPALLWVRGTGAERCIDARSLALAVEELVGPVLVRAADAENAVEGYVATGADGQGLRVRLRVLDVGGTAVGERVLEQPGEDCAALTPAIVFVIAMMIDPGVAAHGLPPGLVALLTSEPPEEALLNELEGGEAAAPEPPSMPVFAPPESEEEATTAPVKRPRAIGRKRSEEEAEDDEKDERPRERLGVQAALLVRLSFGEAPRALWSGQERMLFDVGGPISIVAHVRGGAQQGDHAFVPGRYLRLAVLAAGALVCAGHAAQAVLRLHGCAGAEVAGVLARGDRLEEGRTPFRGDIGAVAQLSARLRVRGNWGLGLVVDGRVNFTKWSVKYIDEKNVNQIAYPIRRSSLGVALGPTYEF